MHERRRHAGALVLLVALAGVALVGCPNRNQPAVQSDGTTTAAPKPTLDQKKDSKAANAAVLTPDDLPGSGWKKSTATTEKKGSGGSFDCPEAGDLFSDEEDSDTRVQGSAPTFERPRPAGNVTNGVTIYVADADAKKVIDDAKSQSDEVKRCVQRGFSHEFAKEGSNVETAIENWDIGKVGDSRVGFDITLTTEADGTTTDIYFGLALVRVGRATTAVLVAQLEPLGQGAKDIVQLASDKLADNAP